MPRKTLVRSSILPYHVTARSNNREDFPLELERTWKILSFACYEAHVLFGARTHALVLMPNHFHLLISTPQEDLGVVMNYFMSSATRAINRKAGRSGRIFSARYHWTLVDSERYFAVALKYVYRNPVRARLCELAEAYPFSSIREQIGERTPALKLDYPVGYDRFPGVPAERDAYLRWMNSPFGTEAEIEVRKALKKTVFRSPHYGWKHLLHELKMPPR